MPGCRDLKQAGGRPHRLRPPSTASNRHQPPTPALARAAQDNILLSAGEDGELHAKLTDFGLHAVRLTRLGGDLLCPLPELWGGSSLSRRFRRGAWAAASPCRRASTCPPPTPPPLPPGSATPSHLLRQPKHIYPGGIYNSSTFATLHADADMVVQFPSPTTTLQPGPDNPANTRICMGCIPRPRVPRGTRMIRSICAALEGVLGHVPVWRAAWPSAQSCAWTL